MTIALIIDTDVALGVIEDGHPRDVDDAYAIVEAINIEAITLAGITTVHGNASLDRVDAIARQIVARTGTDVPVRSGASERITETGDVGPVNDAVEFMAEVLTAGRCHIAAIGPLTNIGLLIAHYPQCLHNIESVVMVGGRTADNRFYIGNVGPVNDFNFEHDVRAARLLLESSVPVVMAGFELTHTVSMTARELDAIRAHRTDISEFLYQNSLDWLDFVTNRFPSDAGFHPWDSAAISWLAHPGYFISETRGWRIRESPDEPGDWWLETSESFPGDRIAFITGFDTHGARNFVEDIVSSIF